MLNRPLSPRRQLFYAFALLAGAPASLLSAEPAAQPAEAVDTARGDAMIAEYFRQETALLAERCLSDVQTIEDWTSRREEYRRLLCEMLGLDPWPERTDLRPVVTGVEEQADFRVEKLQFQSMPGLYVTGNLYLPKTVEAPLPAVLYVCGHGQVKKNGVSYGNKTHYQRHGAWFARNGFVCLTIDTIQLGEIEGLHHGSYREGMWWWNSRGYTPAGVEAWNCVRSLDYLQSRPEVDGARLGVTGRSGGGAYSWWIAAIDDRIKAAVPVAGITDLENHVVDGCVEGHCDCMYMVNTYRWNYAQVAALVAPRALLIANTDKDSIFPLDGVERLHAQVRRIYRLCGADDKLGLQISEGPHLDTQELQVAAFHWFNRFLKDQNPLVEGTGQAFFEPEQLKVFDRIPADERTSRIHDTFVPQAPAPQTPADSVAWSAQRAAWMDALRQKCFRGWPTDAGPLDVRPALAVNRQGVRLEAYDFTSQPAVRLRLYVLRREGDEVQSAKLWVGEGPGDARLAESLRATFAEELSDEPAARSADRVNVDSTSPLVAKGEALCWIAPRGVGRNAWDQSEKKQIQNRRRFMLLGQTLAGMQAWDVRQSVAALRSLADLERVPLTVAADDDLATVALYASLFDEPPAELRLTTLAVSHATGPDLLNVLRYLDLPQAVAMAAERSRVTLIDADAAAWTYPQTVVQAIGLPADRLQVLPSIVGN